MIRWLRIVFSVSLGLALATPVAAQDAPTPQQRTPHLDFEAGAVMGITGLPYATATVAVARWSFRVSGAPWPDNSGVQLNAGWVVRDDGNATHTLGVMWARFQDDRWGTYATYRSTTGQYAGLAYTFQVKGFFIEAGPGFGTRNPIGPFRHVYGQIGYVYRIGKYKSE